MVKQQAKKLRYLYVLTSSGVELFAIFGFEEVVKTENFSRGARNRNIFPSCGSHRSRIGGLRNSKQGELQLLSFNQHKSQYASRYSRLILKPINFSRLNRGPQSQGYPRRAFAIRQILKRKHKQDRPALYIYNRSPRNSFITVKESS